MYLKLHIDIIRAYKLLFKYWQSLLQISTDVYDISKALSDDGGDAEWPQYGHCSALIKLLPGNKEIKDILIAHDTWTSYKAMLRILKRYDTYLHENPIESGKTAVAATGKLIIIIKGHFILECLYLLNLHCME